MKNVLVTGASGFVGNHVVKAFADTYHVIPLVRRCQHNDDVVIDLSNVPLPEDYKKLPKFIDVVIHLAGLTKKTNQNATSSADYQKQNVGGTRHLLQLLDHAQVGYFVCVSTLDVYGDTKGRIISEDTPTNPNNAYAESKLEEERVCQTWAGKHTIPLAIARLGIVYGPGEEAYQKAIPNFIRQAVADESLTLYGKGIARRDLIHVDDVALALKLLAQKKTEGIVNIASGTSATIADIAKIINQLTKNTKGITYIKSDTTETSITFDIKKLRALGFSPSVALEEGLRKEIELFQI